VKIDLSQLDYYDKMLKEILLYVEQQYGEQTITSQYRIEDTGVHGTMPLRATDLQCHDDELGETIENEINFIWQYDPARPAMSVCMYHDNRGAPGKHLHFQVHPRTKKR
jgi:hypothetical protein